MIEPFPKTVKNGAAGWWTGPRLDMAALVEAAVAGGWPSDLVPHAAAVAMAETGLQSAKTKLWWAYSGSIGDMHLESKEWGPSFGLWQIRWHRPTPKPSLDPTENATRAYETFRKRAKYDDGWNAWSTHKNGRHLVHLPAAHRAYADLLDRGR